MTILIAEDNEINMLLVKSIIEINLPHADVIEATDGLQAVEQFTHNQPDIVFLDIRMPGQDGYEAARQIRNLPTGAGIPIIALTANAGKEELAKCLEAGMNDYISKPIVQDSITKVLARWVVHPLG